MKIDFRKFYDCIAPIFWDAFEAKNFIKIYWGGAGSGKSVTAFMEMVYNMVVHGCNYLVVRQTANSHRTSTYALTKKIISDFSLNHIFKENKTEMTFECTLNGSKVVFRGLEDVERLKSISYSGGSGILERIIFEEASEGKFESFAQLMVRLRGLSKNYFQIVLLLNPVSSTNWIKTTFFDKDEFDVYKHHSTFRDNPFIDDNYRKTLEGFKSVDLNFYNIYCLGRWGVTEGKIFNNYENKKFPFDREKIDITEILAGNDHGFNHPSTITLSYEHDGDLYTFDEIVAFESTNIEFIDLVKEFNFIDKRQRVCSDPAEPARIKEWQQHGYSFLPAKKGKDSVLRTIDHIKSYRKWYIDAERCPRLMQEVDQYAWRVDKDGNPMDEPVNIMDDCIAAIRYSIEHLALFKGKPSVLSGSKSTDKKDIIEVKKEERKKMREVLKAQRKKKRELNKK